MAKANALMSLYGGKDALAARTAADALCGNVGGQARIQETWSPEWIVQAAHAAMDGIEYDPCAASDPRAWFADRNTTLPPEAVALEARMHAAQSKPERADLARKLKPYYFSGSLTAAWNARSAYVNNPFKWLEAWLRKCVEEAQRGTKIVQLGPVRTHREWWRPLVRTGHVVYLRYDVCFQGHRQAFPAPLALVSWNCIVPYLGERETGRE